MPAPLETEVLVVGGGPAGLVLALLLARRGVRVTVLERHENFDREYRGEVLMPRFVQMARQAGFWDVVERAKHLKLDGFEFYVEGLRAARLPVAKLSPEAPFILWMPQPVLLGALCDEALKHPAFTVLFGAHFDDFIREKNRVAGAVATIDGVKTEIRARVVVGADGRGSTVRARGGFETEYENHDFDILWFTIPKPEKYDNTVRAFVTERHNYVVLPKYPNHVQCGMVLRTDEYSAYRKAGIGALKKELHGAHPLFREFAKNLIDFSPFALLVAKADRVKKWAKDGLLLVGDAAHTCSPAGAIGVSVAVGSAIQAADVLLDCFERDDFSEKRLREVQRARISEVREIQKLQEGFGKALGARSPIGKFFAVAFLYVFAKTPLFRAAQRRVMVLRKPLPLKRVVK